jgi:hypothetical protein
MQIFQRTVLQEFVDRQDTTAIQAAYELFKVHFGNATIQQHIVAAKEEQYQEGFAKDFFVALLGYTLYPQPNYNLKTEFKNEANSKKVDVAILKENTVVGVVEMKSTKVNDLQSIERQAFEYKNNHEKCRYVITTNFIKLRLYIETVSAWEEFELFDKYTGEILDYENFAVLYTVLHWKNIAKDLPLTIKQRSVEREEEITLEFYKDYEDFRDTLFLDIAAQNRQFDKFLLFQKTQKFLDRIVFICFASAKGLLPANLIRIIIDEWETFKKLDEYRPLIYFFIKYFRYIDKGFENDRIEIFPYNGGLFAPDEVLDVLKVTDNLLMNQTRYLNRHNYNKDVSIDVLGHIFEHSLNELDKRRAELVEEAEKREQGKQSTKPNGQRKLDGIFYTPAYITQYMINETVGKLCEQKKAELDWENPTAEKLESYKQWLTTLTVLDPACGSGAFLNQALNFFIAEYQAVNNLAAALEGKKPEKVNVHQILENNLYGVDLNEESVAITKLSLWIKTAQMRQKLNDLQDNIKCGNSLIDDEKFYDNVLDWRRSFDWQKNFPQILANRGFTVIVGNPPYVRQENMSSKHKKYYAKRYPTIYHSGADLYVYFYAKALELLQPNGTLAFITPNKWFKTQYGENLRKLLQPLEIQKIIDFFELPIFTDASTEPQIIILKNEHTGHEFDYFPITKELLEGALLADFAKKMSKKLVIKNKNLQPTEWVFASPKAQKIIDKMQGKTGVKTMSLKEYTQDGIYLGVKTALNKAFIIDKATKEKLIAKDKRSADLIKPYARPTAIKKWRIDNRGEYFFINTGFDTEISEENYPAIYNHLKQFDKELAARKDKGKSIYNLRACDYYDKFSQPKIIYIYTAVNHYFYYDTEGFYVNNSCFLMSNVDRFLAAFLNSQLFKFYKKLHFVAYGNAEEKGRNKLDYNKMLNVPIPILTEEQKQFFEENIAKALVVNQNLHKVNSTFFKRLSSRFSLEKPTEKLATWYEMDWAVFMKELKKANIKVPLKQEVELLEIFETHQQEAQGCLLQIADLDRIIDQAIYQLYDLSQDEIRMVENA